MLNTTLSPSEKTVSYTRFPDDSPGFYSSDSDDSTLYTDNNGPCFLLIENASPQNKSLATFSHFAMHKGLQNTTGEPRKCVLSGALLMKCATKPLHVNFLKIKSFVTVFAEVFSHKTLTPKVIRSLGLKYATETGSMESFDAWRITLEKGFPTIPTNTFLYLFPSWLL